MLAMKKLTELQEHVTQVECNTRTMINVDAIVPGSRTTNGLDDEQESSNSENSDAPEDHERTWELPPPPQCEYSSKHAAMEAVHSHCRRFGYELVIGRKSKKNRSKQVYKNYLVCKKGSVRRD